MATPDNTQQPQTDPYAEFGGQIASPQAADPYAEFGGQATQAQTTPKEEPIPTGVMGALRGYYDMGIKPLKQMAGQFYTDLGQTLSPTEQEKADMEKRYAAQDAHATEVYHKASADFHKALATRNVGGILKAGWDLSDLFTNDYEGANKNDIFGNIATAAIRGAEDENSKVAEHAAKVVASVKKAVELHHSGDTAGALNELTSHALPEASQTVGHQIAETIPLIGPAADKAATDIGEGHVAYGLGEAGALLTPEAVRGAKEFGLVGKVADVTNKAADAVKNSALGQKLTDLGSPGFAPDTPSSVGDVARGIGQKVPGAIKDAARTAGQAVGIGVKGAVVATKAAAPVAGQFLAGIGDTLSDSITEKLSNASDSASGAVSTLKEIRDTATQTLTDAGIHPSVVKSAVSDLMDQVQDKYAEWTNPSVSGGSPDAVPDAATGVKATVTNWLNDLTAVDPNKTAIARAVQVDPDLAKVVTPGQMAGGGLRDAEKWVRKSGHDLGKYISNTYDAPAKAAADSSLDKAIAGISPESADFTQQQRIAGLDKALDQSGQLSPEMEAELKSNGYTDEEIGKAVSGKQVGNAFLRMGLTDSFGNPLAPELAFSRMRSMSDVSFNNLLSKVKDAGQVETLRQGYVRSLADATLDPETGSYHLGVMKKLIDENRGKLGTHWAQFRTLGDGLAELEDHIKTTNTTARGLWTTIAGTTAMGLLDVVVAGADPVKLGLTIGAEALAYKYGAPLLTDLLMKPRNIEDMNILFRAASKVPQGAADHAIKKAANAATRVKKNIIDAVAAGIKDQMKPQPAK